MLKTLSAVLIATSLIAGPALAQGTSAAPAANNPPAKAAQTIAPAKPTAEKMATHKTVKVTKVKTRKHVRKMIHHRRHAAHIGKQTVHVVKVDTKRDVKRDARVN